MNLVLRHATILGLLVTSSLAQSAPVQWSIDDGGNGHLSATGEWRQTDTQGRALSLPNPGLRYVTALR